MFTVLIVCWLRLQEAQQSSLLDMEMADYERLVKELNAKLVDGEECAVELKAQINTLNQKEDTLKQEIRTCDTMSAGVGCSPFTPL